MQTEPAQPAGAIRAAGDDGLRSGEQLAVALNRVRRQFEELCAEFVETDKPLYLDELRVVRRELDAVHGKVLYGEFAGGLPTDAAAVAGVQAADAKFVHLLTELGAALAGLRSAKQPVHDLQLVRALIAGLQAAVEQRFNPAGA